MRPAAILLAVALAGCDAFAPDVDLMTLSGTYEGESDVSYVRGVPLRLVVDSTTDGRMHGSVTFGPWQPVALADASVDPSGSVRFSLYFEDTQPIAGVTWARWTFSGTVDRKGRRMEGTVRITTSDPGDARGRWLVERE